MPQKPTLRAAALTLVVLHPDEMRLIPAPRWREGRGCDLSAYPRACSEGIVCEEVGDELVVYVQATQTAHALSGDAASVWRCCDGERSAGEIARLVGLDEALVARAVEQLSVAGLRSSWPEGISRRALHKRAAKFGAAALSAPLIYSIAIPAAAAAASGICANLALSATGDGQFGQVANDPDGAKHYTDDFDTVDSASATFRVTNKGPGTFGPVVFAFFNAFFGGYTAQQVTGAAAAASPLAPVARSTSASTSALRSPSQRLRRLRPRQLLSPSAEPRELPRPPRAHTMPGVGQVTAVDRAKANNAQTRCEWRPSQTNWYRAIHEQPTRRTTPQRATRPPRHHRRSQSDRWDAVGGVREQPLLTGLAAPGLLL